MVKNADNSHNRRVPETPPQCDVQFWLGNAKVESCASGDISGRDFLGHVPYCAITQDRDNSGSLGWYKGMSFRAAR